MEEAYLKRRPAIFIPGTFWCLSFCFIRWASSLFTPPRERAFCRAFYTRLLVSIRVLHAFFSFWLEAVLWRFVITLRQRLFDRANSVPRFSKIPKFQVVRRAR